LTPVHIQCHCQLQGIQSTQPADVGVLLEETFGFLVVTIGYRNHR
jgi:hypothetical protein